MKIGILTQPLINNYGGILQNYALQRILLRLGHEVQTIDWRPSRIKPARRFLRHWKDGLLYFLRLSSRKPVYILSNREQLEISQNTDHFINRYISLCQFQGNGYKKLTKINKRCCFDTYIVGSDQVWRPSYNAMQTSMFLDFCKNDNVKRIAYAASFGTSEWEFSAEMERKCSELVKLFDLITVRENSGTRLCEEHFGVNAIQVLDPTMLLDKDDYIKLTVNEDEQISEGNLYYYILDYSKPKSELIESIAQKNNMKPFTVMPKFSSRERTRDLVKKQIDACVFPSVTKWIRGFEDAKMVIVDSFHGAVFSIIFNKPFWIIENESRGNTRFDSLLDLFGLRDRLITVSSSDIDWNRPIDWGSVNKILFTERNRCTRLLDEVLYNN